MQDLLLREYGTFDVNISDGSINWPEPDKNGIEKPNNNEK